MGLATAISSTENVGLSGMNKVLIIFFFGILFCSFVYGSGEYVPNEIFVKYKNGSLEVRKLDAPSIKTESKIKNLEVLDIKEKAEEYSKREDVLYAEPNYIYHTFWTPNDEYYSLQWHLKKISSEESWNLTKGNESVVIAIIDTGVEWNHSDLEDNIWNNTDETINGYDDDGNGYIDDIIGYDFVDVQDESECSSLNEDCNETDSNPIDLYGHGTHCAGIAAAKTNNSIGISGICPNCKIMVLRAGYRDILGRGSLQTPSIIQAINYSIDNGADIISMSFGATSSSSGIEEVLQDAYDAGIILVAAAGNENTNTLTYPAAYDNVLSVGATNASDLKSNFSNYGSWVDIAAPGSNITSSYLNNGYASADGTSMSTPLVAGSIGLIKSLLPEKTQNEILEALNLTGYSINFITNNLSRIDVYSAILFLDNIQPEVYLVSPENNEVNLSGNKTFTCNATDWQLKNITLKIWNESSFYYNETKNLTGTQNETSFDIINIPLGDYEWNCFVYDEKDNLGFSSSNFTFTSKGILVNLSSPLNNTYTKNNETNFTCQLFSYENYNLTNVTFYLWNNESNEIKSSFENISGTDNQTIFTSNFTEEGNYSWNCLAYNEGGNYSFATSNHTIIFDATSPQISSLNEESITSSSAVITWGTSEPANSSVDIGGSFSEYNTTHSFALTGLSSSTTYNYIITSCDRAENCVNDSGSFTTLASTYIGSGGSSRSTGTTSGAPPVIEIKQGEITKKSLKTGETFSFSLNNNSHSIRVLEIGENQARILIQSSPINLTLNIGEERKVNLSSIEYYDLKVALEKIELEKAVVVLERIYEKIRVEPKTKKEEIQNIPKEEPMSESLYFLFIILLIILLFFFRWKRIKRKETTYSYGKSKKVKAKTLSKR